MIPPRLLYLADDAQTQHRVAHNDVLRENVFMIVVTSQLNIPLFLVGKPGSSKSLVAHNIKGSESEGRMELEAVKLVCYQCSPLVTPKGVTDVFRDTATQQRPEMEADVSDGMGTLLLEALHGLLEEGSLGLDGIPGDKSHRTGVVVISNWALDPDISIFLSHSLPTERQLIETAECICEKKSTGFSKITSFIAPLTAAYLEIHKGQDDDYEFYGLRDFYAVMKQLAKLGPTLRPEDVVRVIQHTFSGQKALPAFTVFASHLRPLPNPDVWPLVPKIPVQQLIQENICGSNEAGKLNRYLLRDNDAARHMVKGIPELAEAEVIFGSRFPQDLEYTHICRNMNRIRLCMEQGRPAVLLNLESLYESLYDLLNQAFVEVRGEFVVDIGLGSHRHRTRVNPEFRLVVLAEYDEVRRCFPATLVNRLEKHTVFLYSDMGCIDKDGQEADSALDVYAYSSLGQLFAAWLGEPPAQMLQIWTSLAQIISTDDAETPAAVARRQDLDGLLVWQLQDRATELQFESALSHVFSSGERCVLLIQFIPALQHPKLVASCRHNRRLEEIRSEWPGSRVYVGLVLHRLPFHLTDRVAKWAASSHDQFRHVCP